MNPGNLNRRDFGRLLTLGTAAVAAPSALSLATRESRGLLKPPRLEPGHRVAVVAPATMAFEADKVRITQEQIEALGYEVVLGEHVFDKYAYFAGRDEDRAADINWAFNDDSIDAIIFMSGGWGSPRLLPYLDYDAIRANPKIILGFSDITALLNGIHQKTGLVTFHGPNGSSRLRPYTLDHFNRALTAAEPLGTLSIPPKDDSELVARDYRIITIREGKATGRLTGGNLSLIAALMGTPWEIDTRDSILLIEDVNEAIYRVDRMLTQLRLGGKLQQAKAIVFGYCTRCPSEGPSFSLEELYRDHFEDLGVPVMAGFAFGHIGHQVTLPIGMEATVDAAAGTITIDEPAVR